MKNWKGVLAILLMSVLSLGFSLSLLFCGGKGRCIAAEK